MRLDPAQLAALAAVVELGSFEAAARSLHVTPSAVSQRVKALEQRSGQVLVRRSRPCRATAAGQALVRLAGQMALLEREALRAVEPGAAGPVTLAVAVNADSLSTWFPAALAGLPDGVLVDLRREDQDHSADLLRAGDVMAAVTADARPVQGCRSVPLGAMRYLAVASPSFAARWLGRAHAGGVADVRVDGRVDEDAVARGLAEAPLVSFNRKDALQARFLRDVVGRRVSPPEHLVPSNAAFVGLVRAGLAWGMVPEAAARPLLAAGELVEVVPGRHLDVPLHWQHWRLDAPVLADLTDRVVRAAGASLHAPAPRGPGADHRPAR